MDASNTEQIIDALLDTRKLRIEAYIEERMSRGMSAYELVEKLTSGLEMIGAGYRERYFDAELMVSGWNAKKALEILRPFLEQEGAAKAAGTTLGTVVIGTVKGDVHDIGKEVVEIMLASAGFRVVDLGIDVDKERFARAVSESKADVLALSALLTTTREYMAEVISHLRSQGLSVPIIVGGGAVTEDFARKIGADYYCKDAIDGVTKVKELLARAG
ncbi:MAG TPA: cobalamin-binding protein [Methanomicrobia archaeon]|nr:cobalamin-binding protein [Methanomicrobia archaeon]